MKRSAVFSECKTWRYTLERYWGDGDVAVFILLNPSTADAEHDDPTNRRGIRFAKDLGYDGCIFLNLFAYRTPSPSVLMKARDPIGPLNDGIISGWCTSERAGVVIAAWGGYGTYMHRNAWVRAHLLKLGVKVHCFGRTMNHQPRHILYLKADTQLERYL